MEVDKVLLIVSEEVFVILLPWVQATSGGMKGILKQTLLIFSCQRSVGLGFGFVFLCG